ncbi:hypothetical protein [Granulicella sibirica]|uniref:Uncharacterized protein n=1 Tax=Granulicella sibirica TaxID=2479048 RepID=A0A4Q0T515_9BACT|nr:hypothetical protein [Granulicella sibirica]RXH56696.1 hypothetical protein GRAN_3553 [Granulicella sibirica]
MTREDMLIKMHLSEQEFVNYIEKLTKFMSSLTEPQLQFHMRLTQQGSKSGVKAEDAAKAFGPQVTAEELTTLFESIPPSNGVTAFVNMLVEQFIAGNE